MQIAAACCASTLSWGVHRLSFFQPITLWGKNENDTENMDFAKFYN
jgi:hypothetical protein